MKIKTTRDHLLLALGQVIRTISPSMPILSGLLILALPQGLHLRASDSKMTIQVELSLQEELLHIQQIGRIVVPAKYLFDIVRKLPSGTLTLELIDPLLLTVRSERATYRLAGMEAGDFPEVPDVSPDLTLRLSSSQLLKMVQQVAFAVSPSEQRPVLTGVSMAWDRHANQLQLLATDGVRFASLLTNIDDIDAAAIHPIILPGRSLMELSRILTDDESPVDIQIGSRQVLFRTNQLSFYTALIEGTYPAIDPNAFAAHTTRLVVQTEDLLHALDRVSILAGDGHIVRLETAETHVNLFSSTEQVGDVNEQWEAKLQQGEDIRIAFNSKYMRDILRTMVSRDVCLTFQGKWSPIRIEPLEQEAASKAIYILTPVRTHGA
ncbi:DNA polymerase III subunit beta [Paenibacillus guangzhouensis]|uniref:DNA polymerase III subunit beta n=1 Tax=Paenibacillus guangzhouensis TaxID=1473112 RepID=UPI0012671B36|nr:DNA polymerase III subunit beta [Paenibacillus guangzhouensis]